MKNKNNWIIEKDGGLCYPSINYYIPKEQLLEEDWIIHLMKKTWFDLNDFMPKYFEALKRIGVKEITILVDY